MSSDVVPPRWTDDRLDDLAKVVYHNDGRLDTVEMMATQSHNELESLRRAAQDRNRSRVEQAMIAAALASPVVTLLVSLLTRH